MLSSLVDSCLSVITYILDAETNVPVCHSVVICDARLCFANAVTRTSTHLGGLHPTTQAEEHRQSVLVDVG